MTLFIEQLFKLLTDTPGSMVYYLILGFTILGVLLNAVNQWRLSGSPRGRRFVIGICALFAGQMIVFVMYMAAFAGLYDPRAFMPVIDRFVLVESLVLVFWMWAFPKPSRLADAVSFLFLLLVGVALVFSLFIWNQEWENAAFNPHWLGTAWNGIAIFISAGCMIYLALTRPAEWTTALVFFGITLVGYIGATFFGETGDISGAIRFTTLATFPLLFILPQRFLLPYQEKTKPPEVQSMAPHRRRFGVDPNVLDAVLALLAEKNPGRLCPAISRLVAQSMLADICFLLTLPDDHGDIVVQCAYDLIREKSLSGAAFNENSAPILSAALAKGRSLRLPSSSMSPDLTTLSSMLELQKNGHLMMAPVIPEEKGKPIAGLAVLSPYSNRNWSLEEQAYLEKMARAIGRLIARVNAEAQAGEQARSEIGPDGDAEQLRSDLRAAQERIHQVDQENEALLEQLKQTRQAGAVGVEAEPGTEAARAQEIAREQIADLMLENQQLKETLVHYMEGRGESVDVETQAPGAVHLERDALKRRLADLEGELESLRLLSTQYDDDREERQKKIHVLASAQAEAVTIIQSLQKENERLQTELNDQAERLRQGTAADLPGEFGIETKVDADMAAQTAANLAPLLEENEQMEREMRKALEQVARLQALVGESKVLLFQAERQALNSTLAQQRLQVIVDMARELRQPMASITGYTDFLLSESVGILGTLQRKFLERIRVSTDRLDEMVESLLQNAEAEFGKLSLSPLKAVRMNDVIDHAVSQTSGFIMEKNITMQVDIPTDLPVVSGDADALNQIFFHLLRNAGDVTPVDGEIIIRATVERFGEKQDFIHIQVTDSGGGIPGEYLTQIFDAQANQITGQIPGVGESMVGLVVSKNLIDAHGGRIWVDSAIGKGATFSILLPVMPETEAGLV